MKTAKLLAAGLLLLAVAGCALGGTYQAATASWTGASIEEVIAAWGSPDNTEPRPGGERFYQWVEVISEGPDPTQLANLMAGDPAANPSSFYTEYVCQREITADLNGKIKSAWNSYDCWRSDNIPEARQVAAEAN